MHIRQVAHRLDRGVLAPGGHHQQRVSHARNGFRLGRSETLTLYRAADLARVDRAVWTDRDAPDGGSFARIPDGRGGFRATTPPTPGAVNRAP